MMHNYNHPREVFETIECPYCLRPTDSLKQFTMLQSLVYILVYAFWRLGTYTACPNCMRKIIKKNLIGLNILTANLLWFVIMLPWGLVQLWAAGRPGHSRGVVKKRKEIE